MEVQEPSDGISLIVFETLAVGIQFLSVLFNGAIISTLWKKSLFKCPSNKFVFSLCFAHLLVSALSILISVTQSFITSPKSQASSGPPPVGIVVDPVSGHSNALLETIIIDQQNNGVTSNSIFLSHFLLYMTLSSAIGNSVTIAFISIERYITIARPMKYKSIVTRKRVTGLILFSWVFSLLITLVPVLIFGSETTLHGTIAIPSGHMGLYFALVSTTVTILVLAVMILCYAKIFKIAREKCQKVQIGHLTSPVSSISSDWPSSAYYSHPEEHEATGNPHSQQALSKWAHSPAAPASHSLLQYVLMANLGKQATTPQPTAREPFVLTPHGLRKVDQEIIVRPDTSRLKRLSSGPKCKSVKTPKPSPWTKAKRRSWKAFLQQNYNSPSKTIWTILGLIGSLALTQLPLSLLLFPAESSPALFCVAFKLLFGMASITSPLMYGYLNRVIRAQLWTRFRINSARKRQRAFDLVRSKSFDSRKASISSGDSQFFSPRRQNSIVEVQQPPDASTVPGKIENGQEATKQPILIGTNQKIEDEDVDKMAQTEVGITNDTKQSQQNQANESTLLNTEEDGDPDEKSLSSSLPRKPSQDSGADVSFSDEEEDIPHIDDNADSEPEPESCNGKSAATMRIRIPARLSPLLMHSRMILQRSSQGKVSPSSVGDSDEDSDEDEDDYDDDEELHRLKQLMRKKFSITGDDEAASGIEEYLELYDPIDTDLDGDHDV